jgi:hypothetical protein
MQPMMIVGVVRFSILAPFETGGIAYIFQTARR